MKTKVKDERIEAAKLSVYKEVTYVLLAVVAVSLFEKAIVFHQGIDGYIRELVFLAAIVLYIFIRNLWLGNIVSIAETVNKKVVALSATITSVAGTLLFAINHYATYTEKYTGLSDGFFWGTVMIVFVQMLVVFGVGFYLIGQQEAKKSNV